MLPNPKQTSDIFFDYLKEIYEDIQLANTYCQAGLIFRGNFVVWIADGDGKSIYVIDTFKKITYFTDLLPIRLSTARVVTEDWEIMILYQAISSTFLKLILKEVPPNPKPLPKAGTAFIPGTTFSQS